MHKSLLLLATLGFAKVALATRTIDVVSNVGARHGFEIPDDNQRCCVCLSQTQTAQIEGANGGTVKLFSKSDCTGNYADGSGRTTYNAQWVNSVSFGASGVPSDWGFGNQCSWY